MTTTTGEVPFLISIIVPVFNLRDRNLDLCIESLLLQTYDNIEIVIVDNNSNDGSLEICEKYASKDHRITIYRENQKGVSYARNTGLDRCKGEYISFVDGDDIVKKNYIQELYNALRDCNTLVSACRLEVLNVTDEIEEWIDVRENVSVTHIVYDEKNPFFCGEYMHKGLPGMLFHRSVLRELRFDTSIAITEDVLFLSKVWHENNRCAFINECLYGYITYANSAMHSPFSEKNLTSLLAWKQVISTYSDTSKKMQDEVIAGYVNACLAIVLDIRKHNLSEEYKEVIQTNISEMRKHQFKYYFSLFSLKRKVLYMAVCYIPRFYF